MNRDILLKNHGCAWIEGDPRDPTSTYCNADCVPYFPWCKPHLERVYQKAPLKNLDRLAELDKR